MGQVKQGRKTLLDLLQASSTKKCRQKGLDSPSPVPSINDPSYAISSSKIGEAHYLRCDEKSSDNCPVSKRLIRQKK